MSLFLAHFSGLECQLQLWIICGPAYKAPTRCHIQRNHPIQASVMFLKLLQSLIMQFYMAAFQSPSLAVAPHRWRYRQGLPQYHLGSCLQVAQISHQMNVGKSGMQFILDCRRLLGVGFLLKMLLAILKSSWRGI